MLRKKIEVGMCNVQVWCPDTVVPDPPLPQLSFTLILADPCRPCLLYGRLFARSSHVLRGTVGGGKRQFRVSSFSSLCFGVISSYSIFYQVSLLQFQLVGQPKSLGCDDTASPFYPSYSSSNSDFPAVANLQINSSSWLAFQSFVICITSLLFGRNILNSFSFLRVTLNNAGMLIIDIYSALFL